MEAKCPWPIQNTRGVGAPPIVEYVIEAEFDIDTGSTVRYQYPSEVPDYKPDWFAEHMLPEGAHNRVLDYTYVFLNRGGYHVDTFNWIKPEAEFSSSSSSQSSPVPLDKEKKPFLYGLNLVKTRHDSTVRRGAIVKAMCILSRYSFIEALKRPLEMALDEFFDNQTVGVLERLYKQLNSVAIDRFPAPTLLEQQLMRRGVHYDTIRPALPDHLPRSWMYSFECRDGPLTLTLQFPLCHTPDEVGEISVVRLVKTFGEATMKIFHGILTKQRVLFVGYGHAAHDIAQMVLSAVAMVAPPMTNLIRRTFPYANLTDLSFLEVKGYIAGVTNPMFQQRESWWDVLCVLDLPNGTGTVVTAEDKKESSARATSSSNNNNNSSGGGGGGGVGSGVGGSAGPNSNAATSGGSSSSSSSTSSSANASANSSSSSSVGGGVVNSSSSNNSGSSANVTTSSSATANADTAAVDAPPVRALGSGSGTGSAHASRANLASMATDETATTTATTAMNSHASADTRFIQGVLSGVAALIGEDWVRQEFADYTTSLLVFIQDKNMLLHMSRLDDRTRRCAEANLQRLAVLETFPEFRDMPRHPWVWDTASSSSSSSSSSSLSLSPSRPVLAAAAIEEEGASGSNANATSTSLLVVETTTAAVDSSASSSTPVAPPTTTTTTTTTSTTTATSSSSSSSSSGSFDLTKVVSDESILAAASSFNPLSLKTKLLRLRLDQAVTFTREMEIHFLMAERHLVSEAAMQGLVLLFPESQGGLTPFAAGLFHASPLIRFATLMLLNRIRGFPSTRAAFDSLNTFVRAGHQRLQDKWDQGLLFK